MIKMKKTKIVATIGPNSENPKILKKLSEAGVNVFRLNFSHGNHEEHGKRIDNIRKLKLPGGILLDTKGPEIRVGEIRGELKVKPGDKVTFTIDNGVYEDTGKISVNYPDFIKDVKTGTTIVIDSGVLKAEVKKIKGHDVICEITSGTSAITTKRHINLMGEHVSLPTITKSDWKDIEFGIEKKVDFIALSFVRTAKDIEDVRKFCAKKGHIPHIIAKIENCEAVDNLEEIIEASDGIMVARGDLACEISFAKVPLIQREILELCNFYAKPVIVATQMLLSMVNNITPTRAEVSDVANAVFDGADAVMTSDETTKGNDPVNVIQTMARITYESEESDLEMEIDDDMDDDIIKYEMAKSSVRTLDSMNVVNAIVVISKSGKMVQEITSEKPECPIFAFTDNDLSCNTMSLLRNVIPSKIEFDSNDYEKTIKNAIKVLKSNKQHKIKKFLLISYYMADGKEYPLITLRNI